MADKKIPTMEELDKAGWQDLLDTISAPAAAARGAAKAALTDQDMKKMALEAFLEPTNAPTGEDIAEASGLSDQDVLAKTAIATGADFMDPLDIIGLGLAGKAAKTGAKMLPMGKRVIKPTDAADFYKALDQAEVVNPRIKDFVHRYTPEELAEMKPFLTVDKQSGFALKPDGDIVSAFSAVKGRGDNLVKRAKKEGGRKLDAFEGYLTEDLYPRHGFKEVRREPNWTPGEPDVVFMELSEKEPSKFQDLLKRIKGK